MKICPICKTKYPDDANFCPLETCASADGPQRLDVIPEEPEPRFKPLERIGGGNTGEIWRARDNQTGTDVALKLVNPEIAGSAANQSRVEREFKQLMRVASPRVASIIDCGRMPDQRLFVAMELFPAESLASVLRAGPVDLDTAKNIIGQVGQALLEAQKAGLVHRDVSPKNVLVGPNGDVKVINFPLAKPVTDKVSGEPAYLSPEQAQGKPADQRSNTYSLAAILYHLLTGEPPFQAPSVQAVLDMHVSSPVLPPSQKRPDAQISTEADRLMLKALDKTSSRRHLTLRLFLTELDAVKPAAAGQAAGAAKGDVGMAKTMLFAGNQADVARMVADAMAARNAAAAAAAPAQAQPAAPAQPAAKPQAPANPISVMATLAVDSMPVPAQPAPSVAQPVAQAPARQAPQAAAPKVEAPAAKSGPVNQPATAGAMGGASVKPAQAGAAPPPKGGAAFRETLWFKKGDVEQLVADAKAKLAAGGKPPAEGEMPTEDVRPLEDRYVDDGSVTTEDRKKFSLRTGGTATALPAAAGPIPGQHMNEADLVQEIGHGRRTAILLVAIAVVVIGAVVVIMSMKGGAKEEKKVGAGHTFPPSAAAMSSPAPAPTPAPAPKAEPTPAPAAAPAAAPTAAAAPAAPAATATATSTGTAAPAPAAAPVAEKAAKADDGAKAKAAEPAADEGGKKAAKAKPAPAPHKKKKH